MALYSYGAIDEGNACASRLTFRETQLKGRIENVYINHGFDFRFGFREDGGTGSFRCPCGKDCKNHSFV
jgi:hypothetical protein